MTDPWERRIAEMGDGRPASEIVEAVWHDEIRAGAWIVDIGLWKSLFEQRVRQKLYDLVRRRVIYFEPSGAAREESHG